MFPINCPSTKGLVLGTNLLFIAGRERVISHRQEIHFISAVVLRRLHKISLQVVKETGHVHGCTCCEVGKELEHAEASHLLYAVLEYLLSRLVLLAATCIRYRLIFRHISLLSL